MGGGVDSAWLSILRDFGAWEWPTVFSTRDIREGWIFPFEIFGVFGGLAPLEIEAAVGEAERLRFEVTGIDLDEAVSEVEDSGAEDKRELSRFVDEVERTATSDSVSEEVPEDEDTERLCWFAEDSLF